MANSSVPVNPGTAVDAAPVDTFTQPGGDHRQAVVVGDAANPYVAVVDAAGNVLVRPGVTPTSVVEPAALLAATSAVLLPANALRVVGTVQNDINDIVYLALAATATLSAYSVKLHPGAYFEVPVGYSGPVAAICPTAGTVRVTTVTY